MTHTRPWRRIARIAAITLGALVLLVVAAIAALVIYVGSSVSVARWKSGAGVAFGSGDQDRGASDRLVLVACGPPAGRHLGRRRQGRSAAARSGRHSIRSASRPSVVGRCDCPGPAPGAAETCAGPRRERRPELELHKEPGYGSGDGGHHAGRAHPKRRRLGQVDIKDGHFTYEDKSRDLVLEGDITTATGEAEKVQGIRFEAKGTMQGKKLLVRFAGGSIMSLRDEDKPYPRICSPPMARPKSSKGRSAIRSRWRPPTSI